MVGGPAFVGGTLGLDTDHDPDVAMDQKLRVASLIFTSAPHMRDHAAGDRQAALHATLKLSPEVDCVSLRG